MSQKPTLRSIEWLTACKALDLNPRILKVAERLRVRCYMCDIEGEVNVGNADYSLKTKGYAWCCHGCKKKKISQSASARVGEKNPFYGKRHSDTTKEKISVKQKERLSQMPEDERKRISEIARAESYKKYGGNPMQNFEIRKKQWDATHTDAFIKNATLLGNERAQVSGFSAQQSNFSKDFWNSEDGSAQRGENSNRVILECNTEGGKFYETRLSKFKVAMDRLFADPDRRMFLANWKIMHPNRCIKWTSRAESELLLWVRSLGLEAQKHHVDGKEIDIFVPSIQFGIEYNGLYWHSEAHKTQTYHLDKTKACERVGIRLIHIFEHEWSERNQQVKSYLRSALGKNDNRVGARKLQLKEVDSELARSFLEQYHIQGVPGSIKLGLGLYGGNNDLISLATFSTHHRNNAQWVLNRFVTKENWTVMGGLSRLSQAASVQIGEPIATWADKRLSQGRGYEAAGWLVEEVLPPDYFYTDGAVAISKQSRKKDIVGTPDGMTEREHAILDGLFRIYDCGKIRFIYPYVKK